MHHILLHFTLGNMWFFCLTLSVMFYVLSPLCHVRKGHIEEKNQSLVVHGRPPATLSPKSFPTDRCHQHPTSTSFRIGHQWQWRPGEDDCAVPSSRSSTPNERLRPPPNCLTHCICHCTDHCLVVIVVVVAVVVSSCLPPHQKDCPLHTHVPTNDTLLLHNNAPVVMEGNK